MENLKYEIAKCYGVGLDVDQTAFLCGVSVEEIEKLVINDLNLQILMSQRKEAFDEIIRNKKERKRNTRNKDTANTYMKNKLNNDVGFRLKNSFSTLMRFRLKGNKTKSTFESLGYTLTDLKSHLEKLFTEEMTWDNYGEVWHIDHKVPDSWFEYKSQDCEGFKKSWSLENLQPLLKADNLSKGNRFASI